MTANPPTRGMILLLSNVILGCASADQSVTLEQFGSMREVMRDGHVEPRVRLADVALDERTIAVGALAELAGEVTADAGAWAIATADDAGIRVSRELAGRSATLLTVARVRSWEDLSVEVALDEVALSARIAQHLIARGVDPSRPWPVRVVGVAERLDLHVVRGACLHDASAAMPAFRWSAPAGTAVTLIGVRAPGAAGVLTHHGTEFHLHALVAGERLAISGHVDEFALRSGARVFVASVD